MKPSVTVFSTPFYCLKTPQLAPPLLKAYLSANKIHCNYFDLSIRFNVYMQSNLECLYKEKMPIITDFLEGKTFYGTEALNKLDLKFFHKILQQGIPLVPYEFLESKLGEDVIFADRNFRSINLSSIEDVSRFKTIMQMNSFYKDASGRVVRDAKKLRQNITSGIYNQFYQSKLFFQF